MADSTPQVAPGGTYPPAVQASQLDNPPRTRIFAAIPSQITVTDPFNSLSYVDILNMRAAMNAHLTTLLSDPVANADAIASVKQTLGLIRQKLSSPAPDPSVRPQMLPSLPAGIGVVPNPLFIPQKTS